MRRQSRAATRPWRSATTPATPADRLHAGELGGSADAAGDGRDPVHAGPVGRQPERGSGRVERASGQVQSVTDTRGNRVQLAVGPTVHRVWHAEHLLRGQHSAGGRERQHRHRDVQHGGYRIRTSASRSTAASRPSTRSTSSPWRRGRHLERSAAVTTTNATDLIVGANMVLVVHERPGRVIHQPGHHGRPTATFWRTGSSRPLAATAPRRRCTSGAWIMQMVAFKAGTARSRHTGPTAPAEGVGQRRVERRSIWPGRRRPTTSASRATGSSDVSGVGCSNSGNCRANRHWHAVQRYRACGERGHYVYRIRAVDAEANLGRGTPIRPGQRRWSRRRKPRRLRARWSRRQSSGTQIDVSWGAATDNVGVSGYRLERCQGVGCTAFTKLGTTITGTNFSDIGLSLNTSYSYIVRAQDAPGNSALLQRDERHDAVDQSELVAATRSTRASGPT